jgi:predicted ATPase
VSRLSAVAAAWPSSAGRGGAWVFRSGRVGPLERAARRPRGLDWRCVDMGEERGVPGYVTGLEVENFRGLRAVSLPLGRLSVLVGPNGAGKTSLTEVFRFLADSVTAGLEAALAARSGFDRILFRGGETEPEAMRIAVWGTWTSSGEAGIPDLYEITIRGWRNERKWFLSRDEELRFTDQDGRVRLITVREDRAEITVTGPADDPSAAAGEAPLTFSVRRMSSALSALGRLADDAGGEQSAILAAALASVRAVAVDAEAARRAGDLPREGHVALAADAANLAAFLSAMRDSHPRVWAALQADAVALLPGAIGIDLDPIGFDPVAGLPRRVAVVVYERGLRYPLALTEASDGAVRALALLAALHDPRPPALTIVEDIDHGLHPGGFDLLARRLREASARTQILATTRSPGFAERLRDDEVVYCDRRPDGSAGPASLRPPSASAASGW